MHVPVAIMFMTLSKMVFYNSAGMVSMPSKISANNMCCYRAGRHTALAQQQCHVSPISITLSKHGTYIYQSDCTELPEPVSHRRSGTFINTPTALSCHPPVKYSYLLTSDDCKVGFQLYYRHFNNHILVEVNSVL